MNNKIISTALNAFIYFFCVSSVFAGQMETSLINKNGFYIGADIGVADLMNKESHSVMPESHQLSDIGAVGGIFIGYDYGFNHYLRGALEGFVDATGLNTSIQHASNTYKMKQYYNIGIRVLPEYVFTPFTVGHVILGYVNGRFNINDNGVYGLINTNYNRNGFQVGLGVTTAVRSNIFLRLDALYDAYTSNTNQGVGLTTPTQLYTNRFSQLAGEFAVIYKWC